MKKAERYYCVVFLFVSLFNYCVKAQPGKYFDRIFKNNQNYLCEYWNTENGLIQNSIQTICQTKDGYLWIATIGGLMRFDGNKFENVYKSNDMKTSVIRLYEDNTGVLWLVTFDGGLIKYSGGKFIKVHLNPQGEVRDICQSYNNQMYVSTSNGSIYKLNEGKSYELGQMDDFPTELKCANNCLYAATSKGLFVLEKKIIRKVKELSNDTVFALKKGLNNDLWGIFNHRIFKIEAGKLNWMFELPDSLKKNIQLCDFLIPDNDELWVASTKGILVAKAGKLNFITEKNGLTSDLIHTIYKDNQNNIWAGTSSSGIIKIKQRRIKDYTREDGLADVFNRPVIQLKDSSVLIGHWSKISIFKNDKIGLFQSNIPGYLWCMFDDKQGRIWMGTRDSGVYYLKHKQLIKIPLADSLFKGGCKAIFEDKSGVIWIARRDLLFTWKDNKVLNLYRLPRMGEITQIFQDSKNRMWVCSTEGLGVLESGVIRLYTAADGLPNSNVRSIYEDVSGVFWIATYGGGICRLKDGVFFKFSQNVPLMDEFCSAIIQDTQGMFWVSTNHGIYSVKHTELSDYANNKSAFINFNYHGISDGLKHTECNGGFQNSGLLMFDGRVCFPTSESFALVNTFLNFKENALSPVKIEEVLMDGKLHIKPEGVKNLGEIKGNISFICSSPFFGDHSNLKFQYQLQGIDQNWNEYTTNRIMNYNDLPPGNYVFKVRVVGNLTEEEIAFQIPYPFWQRPLFYVLLIVFFLAFLLIAIYVRIQIIKQREAEKLKINKRYASLELKALQGQMNPHFLFNCLNTIKYFVATNDRASTSKYLTKFSHMIRLFLEQSNSNQVFLEDEIKLLGIYIEMEQLRLDNTFDFELMVDNVIYSSDIKIPTIILQPFIENAIQHGLRGLTERRGLLTMQFKIESDVLNVIIDDNGVGRKKSSEKQKDSKNRRKSLGIKNVTERIAVINYIRNSAISLSIEDKTDSENMGTGTRIKILIPLGNNSYE